MIIAYATVFLKPAAVQKAALEKLLADQHDPASPDFHRWLTPEQYADRFGLSRADLARIAAWLESDGLRVTTLREGATGSLSPVPRPTSAARLTPGSIISSPAVTQINFGVPPNAPLGKQPVVVAIGGIASAPVNLTLTP